MAIREFKCPIHGKFEEIIPPQTNMQYSLCPKSVKGDMCGERSDLIEWSVPARPKDITFS